MRSIWKHHSSLRLPRYSLCDESMFVATKVDATNKREYFLLDSHGKLVSTLPANADIRSSFFHDGMLRIGDAAFINAQGQVVIPAGKYESSHEFSEGFCAVTFKSENKTQSGFLDVKGKLALGPYNGCICFRSRKDWLWCS